MLDTVLAVVNGLLLAGTALLVLPALLLLVQIVLALRQPPPLPAQPRPARIAVLIPAHNEGHGVRATIMQTLSQLGPDDRVLVVADNCSDDTAAQARLVGAEVVERHDAERRGKGYALDFGVRHLEMLAQHEGHAPDVVLVLDADCVLSPGLIPRVAGLAQAHGRPVQASYLMHAPTPGLKARVAEFAMRVKNLARSRGMFRLGLPCQLLGTGMAFPWAVALRAPLASGHLAEDMQLGVRLARDGTPPLFCEDVLVTSVFAASQEGERSQRTRWEHGHLSLLVGEGPKLLWEALRRGRFAQAMLVMDMLVPPLALLAGLLVVATLAQAIWALLTGWAAGLVVALLGVAALLVAIVAARHRFAAELIGLGELLKAPVYVLAKLPIYLSFVVRRQTEWVRTKRDH
ncbi:cellulose synthase/poly-beta-1,6-N-acetylglucosamine synthase-like glycosyltransferase [Mitsuaria sp. BK045]|uniref:glycosyltransferase family 2 protein n=1 Tax=unclassified Roseateles TaxID=2626991 RepID=UPI00160CF130|nr:MULTISPECIES: glycosyltransferase family 2 protein [unclassified Roseateles]MBB3291939.1 cellulose synthase/poly-beta-1,6-N-acetylglucosamine synthase-like glycosyltransferase [Mitsuaria sp. BK041]MBB3361156.1 cellulose synthase/poly-beta-1,6-N-acetylglucosamine synthase-like glycosyltransferase [Mitsuaria sp. BK045]